MKVIILAGGLGTRISEETADKPKPMVLIAGKPMLWHIMSIFAKQGFNEFILATGYKTEVIESWIETVKEPWDIKALNTGLNTQTGGRILECMKSVPGERVFATYGDGLGNINLKALIDFHDHQGKLATVTAVRPPARFGVLQSQNGLVVRFGEKNQADAGWINGGFFVFNTEIFNYIDGDGCILEREPLERLANEGQLVAYKHDGFWQCMDTMRDKNRLSELWDMNKAPWKIWN